MQFTPLSLFDLYFYNKPPVTFLLIDEVELPSERTQMTSQHLKPSQALGYRAVMKLPFVFEIKLINGFAVWIWFKTLLCCKIKT